MRLDYHSTDLDLALFGRRLRLGTGLAFFIFLLTTASDENGLLPKKSSSFWLTVMSNTEDDGVLTAMAFSLM